MNPQIGDNIELGKTTFKLDRANGWAMIDGFLPLNKPDNKTHQSIYCITSKEEKLWREYNARLISYQSSINPEKYLSPIGKEFKKREPFKIRYVAVCDTIYNIKNDIKLWEKICYNGEYQDIFGIWLPAAPFKRFNDVKKDKNYFVVLLRLYEIEYKFNQEIDLNGYKNRPPATIKKDELLNQRIKSCIISDVKYSLLKSSLESAISDFVISTEPKINTLKGNKSFYDEFLTSEKNEVNNYQDFMKILEDYQHKEPDVKEEISFKIERGNFADKIKELTGHKCLICEKIFKRTKSFNKENGETYTEVHHIIPVSTLQKGVLGISNVLTLCANHHRQMHYGKVTVSESKNGQFLKLKIDDKKLKLKKLNLKNITTSL